MRAALALAARCRGARCALAVAVLALFGCRKEPPRPLAPQPPITRADGLVTQVLREGTGDAAKAGDKVSVHYVGSLTDGGVFDSSRARDVPFAFWVGEHQVIAGWDDGLLGMREGELRKLTIPAELAYGSEAKPGIPPNSTLVFEVELLDVR